MNYKDLVGKEVKCIKCDDILFIELTVDKYYKIIDIEDTTTWPRGLKGSYLLFLIKDDKGLLCKLSSNRFDYKEVFRNIRNEKIDSIL